jgi:hypothetical protein
MIAECFVEIPLSESHLGGWNKVSGMVKHMLAECFVEIPPLSE